MYKHLLIATDGSELATKGVEQGLALAKSLNARATAVTVSESWVSVVSGEMAMGFPIDEYDKGCAANAAQILSVVTELAKKSGVACETLHVKDQFPAEGIIETAKARGCDLIVMASHGRRGFARLLLGSQANKVVTHSTVPVLICRQWPMTGTALSVWLRTPHKSMPDLIIEPEDRNNVIAYIVSLRDDRSLP